MCDQKSIGGTALISSRNPLPAINGPTDMKSRGPYLPARVPKTVENTSITSVAEVVYLRQSEIETAPNVGNDESAKFIQGVCNKNGELLILVELDKMMTEEEWSDLENI